jgi:hypothetical protein
MWRGNTAQLIWRHNSTYLLPLIEYSTTVVDYACSCRNVNKCGFSSGGEWQKPSRANITSNWFEISHFQLTMRISVIFPNKLGEHAPKRKFSLASIIIRSDLSKNICRLYRVVWRNTFCPFLRVLWWDKFLSLYRVVWWKKFCCLYVVV